MNGEREAEFSNELKGRFSDGVIMRCMLMTINGTLDEVVGVVESLYEHGVTREELYERRRRAWDMYLDLLDQMTLIPNLGR